MLPNPNKQRLRLTHELLDRQLSNNSLSRSHTKESETNRTKNVQSQISELQRKLLDLQKKMENIDVSSSNQEDEGHVMAVLGKKGGARGGGGAYEGVGVGGSKDKDGKERDRLKEKEKQRESEKMKQKPKNTNYLPKNPKPITTTNPKQKYAETSSAQQDSGDDGEIYAKILSQKQKKKSINSYLQENTQSHPKIPVKKQPIKIQPKPNYQQSNDYLIKKSIIPEQNPPTVQKQKQRSKQKIDNSLRNSVKSIKSTKSRKSTNSKKSTKNLQRSLSKRSINSLNSINSKNSFNNALTQPQLHTLQLQNTKDLKRISNLQKQLNHYKRLCQKQQEKIQEYRVMEIQFRKLESNFGKSQQIRKQQKKIIQNLKGKN